MIAIVDTAVNIHRPGRTQVEIEDWSDVDEFLEDVYGVNLRLRRRSSEPREGPLLKFARTTVGAFAIDEVTLAGELEANPDPMDKVVAVWPSAGRVSVECDGTTGEAGPGEITLVSQPGRPHHSFAADVRVTSVLLEPSLVASVATGLPKGQAMLPVRFSDLLPVDAASAQLWKNTVDYVMKFVFVESAFTSPLVMGHAGRLLAAVTLNTFPNTFSAGPSPNDRTDARPVLLRRAMEYIDARATDDIGLADIAEAVHDTPRAVQYMFRKHLETTPLQYLRRLRLHYAHQDLITGDRMYTTVSEIACRWGFAHTGRFAVLYRTTYGQSPHTTLRG